MLVTTLLRHIVFMRSVFCFSGFNQTTIVLRYSAHIKLRKTIKTTKTVNITHKHNMTLTVSSQSIAVISVQFIVQSLVVLIPHLVWNT